MFRNAARPQHHVRNSFAPEAGQISRVMKRHSFQPVVELLEDRLAPATLPVSLADPSLPILSGGGHSTLSNGTGHAVDASGTLVVFQSSAANLVAGDTNGLQDIFVRNLVSGVTTRVNTDFLGAQATGGGSYAPSISADGNWVVFDSSATNLVAGDTNGQRDVFVKSLITGTVRQVSKDTFGTLGNSTSFYGSISGDGRLVAFTSYATNLVVGDTNGRADIFVHDLQTGQTTRVSTDSGGAQANNGSRRSMISGNGEFVALHTYASNLVAGDTNGTYDIFVKSLLTGNMARVSVDPGGLEANGYSYGPSISHDGRYVAFRSNATNLVAGDTNYVTDIFVRDRQTNTTTRVSVDSSGNQSNYGNYYESKISGNGRFVVFSSYSSNLVAGDTNYTRDIFRKDRQTGALIRVSTATGGGQANSYSPYASTNFDGTIIAFSSGASNLVAGDLNSNGDVFVKNVPTDVTTLVSLGDPNNPSITPNSSSSATAWVVSPDGRYVAFASFASNIVPGDTNNTTDIFVRDMLTGITTRVSTDSSGAQANSSSSAPAIAVSNTGVVYVAFASFASNLVTGDTNGQQDIFVKNLSTGVTTRVNTPNGTTEAAGQATGGSSAAPAIAINASGTVYVAFTSTATNLVTGDTNAQQDIFVHILGTTTTTRVNTVNGQPEISPAVQPNSSSLAPAIAINSTTGAVYIAFGSNANNLVTGDTNAQQDIFVHILGTTTTTRVNTPNGTTEAAGQASGGLSQTPAIAVNSSTGAVYVAFGSTHTNLVTGDTNAQQDIFVHQLGTTTTTRVNTPNGTTEAAGQATGGTSQTPAIAVSSAGAVFIAFASTHTNLVTGDSNATTDIFRHQLGTTTTTRVSVDGAGAQANSSSSTPSITRDGLTVVFASFANNLVPGDFNSTQDVFLNTQDPAPTDIALSSSTVLENVAVGTAVGTFSATDATPGEQFFFRLVTGTGSTDNASFTLTGAGALSINVSPNFEVKSSYSIRVRVTDRLGQFYEEVFVITITDVNEAPTLNAIGNQIVFEDSGLQSVLLTGVSPGPETAQTLTFTVVSDNTGVVPNPTVIFSAGNYFLQYTPVANAVGVANITVTLQDNGGTANGGINTVIRNFSITVQAVNDAPTLNVIANQNTLEDSGLQSVLLTGVTTGPANEAGQTLTFTVVSDNTGVVPNPTVVFTAGNYFLQYTPVANAVGVANITVTLQDNGGIANGGADTIVRNFSITVQAVNDAPTLNVIANQNTLEDSGLQSVLLTGVTTGPANEAGQTLTFTVVSDNTGVVPNPTVIFSAGNYFLQYTPVANAVGVANITVTLQDNGGTANGGADTIVRTFSITVQAVNDAPTIDPIANQTVSEDSGLQSVLLTGVTAGPPDEAGQVLTFTAVSDNTGVVPNPTVIFSAGNYFLQYTPVANALGVANITLTLQDNGGIANGGADTIVRTFSITVQAVNDAPTLDPIPNQTVLEDSGQHVVQLTGITPGPIDEAGQAITVTAVSSDPAVIANPTVLLIGGNYFLFYTPLPDANGTITITVTVRDNGGTASGGIDTFVRTFTIDVQPVNDLPTIVVPPVLNVFGNGGLTSQAGFATGISAGPANEAAQVLTITATASNPALFAVQPTIDPATGTLTFATAPGAFGSSQVTVVLRDNGGTASGGQDTIIVTFTLNVTNTSIFATGSDAGGMSIVKAFDTQTGALRFEALPFGPAFTGGVRVAVGDVDGDSFPDVIAAAGPGGGPQIVVYSGRTGAQLVSFFGLVNGVVSGAITNLNVLGPLQAFRGGLNVAAGDIDGDGRAEIFVSADRGGGPQIAIHDGVTGALRSSFFAFAPFFSGGVRVAAGDVNGDGLADIIAAAGPGGGPQVAIFDGPTQALITSFFATAPSFVGGLYVAAGDINGDQIADIVIGAGPGGGPQLSVFDGRTQLPLISFFAMPIGFSGGVRVGSIDINGDGRSDLLASAGPGGGPQVTSYDSATLAILGSFFAYDPTYRGGVFVRAG